MPDLADRPKFERRVARDVNRAFREIRETISESGRRPSEAQIARETELWLIPALAAVFMAGASAASDSLRGQIQKTAKRTGRDAEAATESWDDLTESINARAEGFDPTGTAAVVSIAALAWARRYAARAAVGIARRASLAFKRLGSAAEGLEAGLLDFAHAEVIGITETVAANTAGEEYVISRAKRRGFLTRTVWMTEKVGACKRCRRLNRKREHFWRLVAPKGPPLHPRCRCWLMIFLEEIPSL